MYFERFDKKVIEEFAVRVIDKSFDNSYGEYIFPNDPDNFDAVSSDDSRALEITLVATKNSIAAYVYGKQFAKGRRNLRTKHIRGVVQKPSGELLQWEGGPIREIIQEISKTITRKEEKARKRLACKKYDVVDLCICIDDGGWFNTEAFFNIELNLASSVFQNIFFITRSLFVRYTKEYGFEEYKRIINDL